jgi:hypothetical protein
MIKKDLKSNDSSPPSHTPQSSHQINSSLEAFLNRAGSYLFFFRSFSKEHKAKTLHYTNPNRIR